MGRGAWFLLGLMIAAAVLSSLAAAQEPTGCFVDENLLECSEVPLDECTGGNCGSSCEDVSVCELGCCCEGDTSLGDTTAPKEKIGWPNYCDDYTFTPASEGSNCVDICGELPPTGDDEDDGDPDSPGEEPPTCSNNVMDDGEEGIDCGGPCVDCREVEIRTCTSGNSSAFELFSGGFGQGTARLSWQINSVCEDDEILFFVMRRESGQTMFSARRSTQAKAFTDPVEEKTYYYKAIAVFPDNTQMESNELMVAVEPEICRLMGSATFCYQGSVARCENGEFFSDPCSEGVCVESGGGASCVSASCDDCNRLYGMYSSQGGDVLLSLEGGEEHTVSCEDLLSYNACLLDSSQTVVDQYRACGQGEGAVSSCSDYRSEQACTTDVCRLVPHQEGCTWTELYGAGELGFGVCSSPDDPGEACEACEGQDCDEIACGELGDCFYSDDTCLPTDSLSCNDYTTMNDCIGSPGARREVSVDVIYTGDVRTGGTNLVERSRDRMALSKCYWDDFLGACYKDADGKRMPKYDCPTSNPDYERCSTDFNHPETTFLINEQGTAPSALLYTVSDNAYNPSQIITWYCIAEEGNSCYPDTRPAVRGEIPLSIRSPSRIYYYSEDPARNLEPVRSLELRYDGQAPVFSNLRVSAPPQATGEGGVIISAADKGNVTGMVSADTVRVCADNELAGTKGCTTACGAPGSTQYCIDDDGRFLIDFPILERGGQKLNRIILTATDLAGNSRDRSFSVEKDKTPPSHPVFSVVNQTETTSNPEILAEYNENVAITYAAVDGVLLALPTGRSDSFTFRSSALNNGRHTLTVNASDSLGNTRQSSFGFTVDVPFRITLDSPSFGYSPVTPYDAVISTSAPAHCSYSNIAVGDVLSGIFMDGEFPGTFQADHTASGITWHEKRMWFTCRNREGEEAKQDFYFVVDETPPDINVNATPNPVIDAAERKTLLTITSDESVACAIGNESLGDPTLESSYSARYEREITYDIFDSALHEFEYRIECRNKAGLPDSTLYKVFVQLTSAFDIEVVEPRPYVKTSSPPIIIKTPVTAACEYNQGSSLATTAGKTHTASLSGLSDGPHSLDVMCVSSRSEAAKTLNFVVDTQAPANVSINSTGGCSLGGLSATFTAADNIGISHFNYTVKRGSTTVIPLTSTTQYEVSHGMALQPGIYTWQMTAVDLAGNVREAASTTTRVLSSNDTACDVQSPILTFDVEEGNQTALVNVSCSDNQACSNSFNYSLEDWTESCTIPDSIGAYGEIFQVQMPTKVCAWAQDLKGNKGFASRHIPLVYTPPTCGNNVTEAGEECDGDTSLTCSDLNFASGSLSCTSCRYNTTACVAADFPFEIDLVSPSFGHSSTSRYDVRIATSWPAHCSYSFIPLGDVLSGTFLNRETPDTFLTTHTVLGDWHEKRIWFTCRNELGAEVKEDFYFVVDETAPSIEVEAVPNPVIDAAERKTLLTITSDEAVVCSIDDEFIKDPSLKSSYSTKNEKEFTYDIFGTESHELEYSIDCRNMAELTDSAVHKVRVQLGSPFGIEVMEPRPYVKTSSPPIILNTPVTAACEYNLGERKSLSSSDGRTHTGSLDGLSEGPYSFEVQCVSSRNEVDDTVNFIVDLQPPTGVSIAAIDQGCSLGGLSARFTAEDNFKLSHFNYSVSRGNTVVIPLTSTTASEVVHEMGLESGTYTWRMAAVDQAGNKREAASATTRVFSDNIPCDVQSPILMFDVEERGPLASVKVSCSDDQACSDSFEYSVVGWEEQCTTPASTGAYGEIFEIQLPGKVCAWAEDLNGNEVFASRHIPLVLPPFICGNGVLESGEECDTTETFACSAVNDDFTSGTASCNLSSCNFNTTSCENEDSSTSSPVCGDDVVDEGESCDGSVSLSCFELGFDAGSLSCSPSSCNYNTTACTVDDEDDEDDETGGDGTGDNETDGSGNETEAICNNGLLEPGESCDGETSMTCTRMDDDFFGGIVTCTDSCGFNTSACTDNRSLLCGNGIVDKRESCDGSNFDGNTCEKLRLGKGSLECSSSCKIIVDGCEKGGAVSSGGSGTDDETQSEANRTTRQGRDDEDTRTPPDSNVLRGSDNQEKPSFNNFDMDEEGEDNLEDAKKGGVLALVFIILGLISMLSGGGYLGYKQYYHQEPDMSPEDMSDLGDQPSQRPAMPQPRREPRQPSLDEIRAEEKSELLSALRRKKKEEEREKLFDQFDEDEDSDGEEKG